jgi:hypothetical protein
LTQGVAVVRGRPGEEPQAVARHPSDPPREILVAIFLVLALGARTITWWWSAIR